jgi:hypothetical protein
MRLGKEQAVGVVEVPADADAIPVDEPQPVEKVVAETSPVSVLSEQGALVRSR